MYRFLMSFVWSVALPPRAKTSNSKLWDYMPDQTCRIYCLIIGICFFGRHFAKALGWLYYKIIAIAFTPLAQWFLV